MTKPLVRPGLLVVVSSPSGTGKTTLCHRLLDEFPALRFSVSCTTRKPRPAERDDPDYQLINDDLARAYDHLRAVYLGAQCEIQRMGRVAERLVKESEAR